MTRATWKVLDAGNVPEGAPMIEFDCLCGHVARLPVVGTPLAQIDTGLVFDNDMKGYLPARIQCRRCRRVLERA